MITKQMRNIMPIMGLCVSISILVTVYFWTMLFYDGTVAEYLIRAASEKYNRVDYYAINGLNRLKLAELRCKFPYNMSGSFDKYQLNVDATNEISVDRDIPDTRPETCRHIDFHNVLQDLPHVSIVIPFHNEVWSMLLRTLHSIYNRTPPELLYEIILVDDASSFKELHMTFENYVKAIPKAKLIRNEAREGLIRSRVKGARFAQSKVIVFLDAHIEVGWNWLPPLLQALYYNETYVAIPHIDWIKPDSLKYSAWSEEFHGGFSWSMDYVWKIPPGGKSQNVSSPTDLIPTPTTIGCAMAMYRDYFFRMGAFDEGMRIWGGENIELSFRIWMCGGSLHIVPCSRVGHIFRAYLPYTFPYSLGGGDIILKNYQRLVEVWMDEYKVYYYANAQKVVPFTQEELMSLKARKQLRDQLKCHNFKWFLQSITPGMTVPPKNAVYHGQMKNLKGNICLTSEANELYPLTNCKLFTESQQVSFTNTSQLVDNAGFCVTMTSSGTLQRSTCSVKDARHGTVDSNGKSTQEWKFIPAANSFIAKHSLDNHDLGKPAGMLLSTLSFHKMASKSPFSHLCLSQVTVKDTQALWLEKCDQTNPFQYWIFTYTFNVTILNMSKVNLNQ